MTRLSAVASSYSVLAPSLKIAHLYQEGWVRLSEPRAAQLHIYHTIRGLRQAGHEVTLLALQGQEVLCTTELQVFKRESEFASHYAHLRLSGSRPYRLFEKAVRRMQTAAHLPYLALFDSHRMAEAAWLNLRGISVIHERYNLLALGGAWASRRLGVPFVLEVNADLLEQRKFKGAPERGVRRIYAVWATRACFKAAAKIICISRNLKDHLWRSWGVSEDKLAVLPCGVDVDAFRPATDCAPARQRLGLAAEPVVIWVGGFYPWHDLDLLIESFLQVLHRIPNAKLVLVGDGQSRPRVTEKIAQSGIGRSVVMTGALPQDRIPELLSIADVAVVPSVGVLASRGGTGTPLKLFEYMAAGKAIVATALGEAAEIVQSGHNGLLVEAGDANGFAAAISALLSDPAERGRLGQNARRQAVALHSWEHYTQKLEEIYLDVSSRGRPKLSAA